MPTRRYGLDPVGNYNFYVDGISLGIFSAVEGLSVEVEMIEYRVSDQPNIPRYRPGTTKYGRITLKRGFLPNFDFILWMEDITSGLYERKDAGIQLQDNAGNINMIWNLYRCLPSKWSLGGFDGKGNEVIAESIELAVEEITLDTSFESYIAAEIAKMGRDAVRGAMA